MICWLAAWHMKERTSPSTVPAKQPVTPSTPLPVGSTPPAAARPVTKWTGREENNVGATDLFQSDKVQNQRIYAYWIDAGYSQAQIGYWTDGSYAREVYINATVPDDIFQHYGFVVSTTATEKDASSLIIGGTIGGKPVGNFEKSTVYEAFKAAPIYDQDYTAKDFNHGLPGYRDQGSGRRLCHLFLLAVYAAP